MRVFVTGGAGYVGSHCVRELCQAGHDVIVFDNLVDGGHRQAVDPRATLIVGDLRDRQVLADALASESIDGVMHFAAHLNVPESVAQPLKYYRNNVANTVGLLELMRERAIKRFVFSSTCATYGNPPAVPITEDMPQDPISPYGRSKLAVEWALRDCAAACGLGATALRYFNASGAAKGGDIGEDREPEYHLIPLVLQVALGQRDHIKVFGTDYPTPDGTCVRDYIHVTDLAAAHRLAIENQPEGTFRYYNVGTGNGASVREVIEAARQVTGLDIPSRDDDRREGDPAELYADPAKLRDELGWQPEFQTIQPIVASAWEWHQSHPNGYDDK
ncbi:MAG: UDP-glucose 4-epimerase GalE [Planctomycetota bacterium]|jgi:UDP-glucose-4-epimerase GalE